MIRKNDILDVDIVDMGYNMEGIAKCDGVVLFVPFAIVGERVRVKVINTKQKAYVCKMLEVLRPSEFRTSPKCLYFTKCGGCQTQHICEQYALQLKRQTVQNAITHIAKQDVVVNKTVPSDKTYNYRNKFAFPVDCASRKVGMYKEYSHVVLPIDDCAIQEGWARDFIEVFNKYLSSVDVSIYDEQNHTGLIRHVVGRHYGGQFLFTIVVNGTQLVATDVLIGMLCKKFDNFGLNLNINTQSSNMILSEKFVHIYGLESIDICENGVNYSINNASFFQVNNYIKGRIYEKVFDSIGDKIVVEAYSGAGLLTAMCAKKCQFAYGIEIVRDAVNAADGLAKANNINNMQNICGDSAVVLPKLLASQTSDVTVVLDPPRKGCDIRVVQALAKSQPSKIVYISCNPSTLARDIFNLFSLSNDYVLEEVTPYDMFPMTKHVETVAILKHKNY